MTTENTEQQGNTLSKIERNRLSTRKAYYKNKAKRLDNHKKWRRLNPDYAKKYYLENKPKIRFQQKIWQSKQIKENPYFRLVKNLRNRIKDAIKKGYGSKNTTTETLIGCKHSFIHKHITSLFQPGMTMENYGLWEVDHIIPVSAFDLTKTEEQKKCFHWSNLQPLWKLDNRVKSDKINAD